MFRWCCLYRAFPSDDDDDDDGDDDDDNDNEIAFVVEIHDENTHRNEVDNQDKDTDDYVPRDFVCDPNSQAALQLAPQCIRCREPGPANVSWLVFWLALFPTPPTP